MNCKTVRDMRPGDSGIIGAVSGEGEIRDRLLDMGLTPGTLVYFRKAAPMGDPVEIALRGYELTLRKADAGRIKVTDALDQSLNPFDPYKPGCDGNCSSCAAATRSVAK